MNRKISEGLLFTDQYQLSMAQLYFKHGIHTKQVQFDYFFRNYPDYGSHQAGFCISAGMGSFLDWTEGLRFTDQDLDCLRSQTSPTGKSIFQEDFLHWLKANGNFDSISIQAIPEGRVIHPGTPLAILRGDFAILQILETPFLNTLNHQTLIATKAARMIEASQGRPILEFGLRRAQGTAGNSGVRAAFIGGVSGSSNVGITHLLGKQAAGTLAHSLIQAFIALGEGELGAFEAYADLYPDNCLLLIDTVNALKSGLPNAIRVFEKLQKKGYKPIGIRLDSGDLAYLSMQCAKELNKAGFPDTCIVLSNQLDEIMIWQILSQISQEASQWGLDADELIKRLVFGVGTSLITSAGSSALDGVYKLTAIQKDNMWVPAIKISESPRKTINPGAKKVWRLYDKQNCANVDLVGLETENPLENQTITLRHPQEAQIKRLLPKTQITQAEELLTPVWIQGKAVQEKDTLETICHRRQKDIAQLNIGVKRLVNPHIYHVSLTQDLWQLKKDMISKAAANNYK